MFFCTTSLHLCLQHIIMHMISVYLNVATILHQVIHTVYPCLSQQEYRKNARFMQCVEHVSIFISLILRRAAVVSTVTSTMSPRRALQ